MKILAVFLMLSSVFGCAYMFLYPALLFNHCFTYKQFAIYTDKDFNKNILKNLLGEIDARLSDHKINNLYETNNVYLCNSKLKIILLSLTSGEAFGYNSPFFNKIILSKSNLDSNITYSYRPIYNRRTFTGVLTHELTHTALKEYLGIIKYRFLPSWKNEGFCDYVASETSFPKASGITTLLKKEENDAQSFTYFKNYLKVKYLLDIKHRPINTFLICTIDENQVEQELITWLASDKSNAKKLLDY